MSLAKIPSQSQLDKLADAFEKHHFLATGHARTVPARDRTRAAWQEVAKELNSEDNGCIKTWQQWAKYWKDKKSALKRKVSQRYQARWRTDGSPVDEEIFMTAVEERLLASIGGEAFAIGDSNQEIIPFENQYTTEALAQRRYTSSATSSSLRRRMTQGRRRLIQRAPLIAQRRSQTTRLTERFIALEERRVEVDMMNARSMETLAQSFDRTSQAFLQQSKSLQSLAGSIQLILDKNCHPNAAVEPEID